MQRHGIAVHGAFIIGLDADDIGVGQRIVDAATSYGVNSINLTMMTPLPGTRLWEKMEGDNRIAANAFPEDWKYYTLAFPVARYRNFTWAELTDEWLSCLERFYSYPRIFTRFVSAVLHMRRPMPIISSIVTNVIFRRNLSIDRESFKSFDMSRGVRDASAGRAAVTSMTPAARPAWIDGKHATVNP
jgi:hypothetical protein